MEIASEFIEVINAIFGVNHLLFSDLIKFKTPCDRDYLLPKVVALFACFVVFAIKIVHSRTCYLCISLEPLEQDYGFL